MKFLKSVVPFFLIFVFFPVQANEKSDQIDRLIKSAGFDKLLERIPYFAQGVLKQSAGSLDPEVNSALSQVFLRAFNSEAIRRDLVRTLSAHYDADQVQAYLELRETPLAKKMSELERSPGKAENRESFINFYNELQNRPAPASRLALIEKLDKANQSTQFSVEMQTAFFKAVFSAVDPIMDADMRLGEGELDKMVEEVRQSLGEEVHKRTQASYLYAFRELPDSEIQQYVELCQSAPHRWAIQMLVNAMISALNSAAERSATLMAQAAEQ